MKQRYILAALIAFGSIEGPWVVRPGYASSITVSVRTNTDNDTMYVGVPGSIVFSIGDFSPDTPAAVEFAFRWSFGGTGNLVGPITESNNVVYSAQASLAFPARHFLESLWSGTDPDTTLAVVLDYGPPSFTTSGEVFRVSFTPTGHGIIMIDSVSTRIGQFRHLLGAADSKGTIFDTVVLDRKPIVVVNPTWLPGDANDDEVVSMADIIHLVNYEFKGGPPPLPLASGDVNRDCRLNTVDIIYLVNHVFRSGAAPIPGCA